MPDVKYPHVKVRLVGKDGNAFAVLGKVKQAMQKAGIPAAEITAFVEEASSGDYNHLLQTVMLTVEVS